MSLMQIASHRGGAFLWPENSLLAFRQALALPAEQLELDVHLSADGVPVVHHDARLDRTTDGHGPLRALDRAALSQVRVKGTGGESLPSLEEAVALVRDAGRVLRLEIKADAEGRPYPGVVPACLAVLDAAAMRPRTVLMSFQPLTVAEAAAAGGFASLVLLLEARPWRGMGAAGAIALARDCGATEIGLPLGELDGVAMKQFRAAGLGVGAWAANDRETICAAFALGLDVIATDDPVLALRLREELSATAG
ncbi:glycerophosphodiester phosphodiesterase [Siccirubricoccus sp. KC 17139]|uniref:Glycerophosphodiester phosphodiesterase n=1 Tax=Siccirubricoccus soli TaxID=2899147 RepID=A0ABT1D710_9PROT|nr:glycerophosphodiester phosphodiesterase family protein [Siccirubricoccus soli]MCO6417664.1 glycerophosphodiester phosphodiesterase [Siccirubricoccus soli]MCP2683799.1 glycerophosphodiester phosphodiesterase [Siccirubricoccus soli]